MDFTRNFKGKLFGKRGEEIEPGNPFDMYFKLAKSVRNWQIAFLISSGFSFVLLIFTMILATKITMVPYIIEVNKETGIISNIGDIRKINFVPEDKNVSAILSRHIKSTRAIPLDPVRYGRDIDEQYYFLNDVTKQKLLEYISKDNVEQKMKNKESRDVSITSVLKMRDKTFQVRWTENNYTENGNIYSVVPMTGIFTVDFIKVNSEQMLLNNPLGVIITDFSYSEEM